MGKLNESQKAKRNFRASKKWRDFRHQKFVEQNGRCPICNMKLGKTANLHHKDLNAEHYEDLSNPDNFVFLCNSCHDFVHYKYKAYMRGDFSFDKLFDIWEDMILVNQGEINGKT